MLKIREAMESRGNRPITGIVHVEKFVLSVREKDKIGRSYNAKKKKAINAVELTED